MDYPKPIAITPLCRSCRVSLHWSGLCADHRGRECVECGKRHRPFKNRRMCNDCFRLRQAQSASVHWEYA